MNDFRWQRQLRELRQPVAPPHDLWPALDARLGQRTPRARAPWRLAAALAGAFLLAGGYATHLQQRAAWPARDPGLAAASLELDAARQELRQALQQTPDSPMLRRLLARTQRQQARLRQADHAAS